MDTVYEYLKIQIEKYPDILAVSDEYRSLSFRELDALVTTIASSFPVISGLLSCWQGFTLQLRVCYKKFATLLNIPVKD